MPSKTVRIYTPGAIQTADTGIIKEGNLYNVVDLTSVRVIPGTLNIVAFGADRLMPYLRISLSAGDQLLYPGEPGYLGELFLQPRLINFDGVDTYYQLDSYATKSLPDSVATVSQVFVTVEYVANSFQLGWLDVQVYYKIRSVTAIEYAGLLSGGF
jgi:hypothetical protein